MLILHGIYNLGHKRVACRNDLCTSCGRPRFVVGIFVLVHEQKPISKLEFLGPGLAITFGFGFAIRRSRYKPFLAAKKGVIPLSHSQCPLCAGPLLPRVTPHCYKCAIDICR